MAIAAPISGQLTQAQDSSRGGFFDQLHHVQLWNADYVIGQILPGPDDGDSPSDGQVRLLMMAGRRVAPLVEGRAGLLSGWAERTRAARIDGPGRVGTLLSLGICELEGVIRSMTYSPGFACDNSKSTAWPAFRPASSALSLAANSIVIAGHCSVGIGPCSISTVPPCASTA